MNKLKKITLFLLSVFALNLFPKVTYADTINSSETEPLYIIEVESEEEVQEVIKELEEHNQKSKKLWQKALKESEVEQADSKINSLNNITGLTDPLSAKSEYSITAASVGTYSISRVSKSISYIGYGFANMEAYVSYYKVPYGKTYVFGDINTINLYGTDSNTSISNFTNTYRKIDGNRTLAVSLEYRIGVKNSWGVTKYIDKTDYVEFYTSGSGYWY